MASEITLFDLASKAPNRSWSANSLKTRLVLNYKSIPYTTHWLEFPDIKPHHEALSIPPNPEDPDKPSALPSAYTIPTVRYSDDGTYMMDSAAIAHALEKRHPSPPLHLDTPQQAKIEALWPKLVPIVFPCITFKIVNDLLNERSAQYIVETREKAFGFKIAELENVDVDAVWEEAKPVLRELGDILRENEGGPFVLGEEPSYGDFILVAVLQFFRRIGEDLFHRTVAADPALGKLYEASKQWVEKDT
ncbi:MAG: hypothetical protein LQ345_005459 [Seirophora villosa]|nr:MAG: hypothetical protein LQ345_005459 [Seirophora villosa]